MPKSNPVPLAHTEACDAFIGTSFLLDQDFDDVIDTYDDHSLSLELTSQFNTHNA